MIWSSSNSRLAQLLDFITAIAGYYLSFYLLVYLNNPSLNNFSLLIEIDSLLHFTLAFFQELLRFCFFGLMVYIVLKDILLLLMR